MAKVTESKKTVPVVIFDESMYGLRKRVQPSQNQHQPNPVAAPRSASKSKVTDLDDIKDMEISTLMSRIKASVDDIATSGMDGKERQRFLKSKMNRLAGIELKNHASFKVRMGMIAKEKERAAKQQEQIRRGEAVIAKASVLAKKLKEHKYAKKATRKRATK